MGSAQAFILFFLPSISDRRQQQRIVPRALPTLDQIWPKFPRLKTYEDGPVEGPY
jgi:hypothetical protein